MRHEARQAGSTRSRMDEIFENRVIGKIAGDKIYLTGPAGLGNVYAFLRTMKPDAQAPRIDYRPTARIPEGRLVRKFASRAMDTSDGLIHAADTLMRLNGGRFVLSDSWEKAVHPLALEVCRSHKIPPWLALADVHGEFELCFTLDPGREAEFLAAAAAAGWAPLLTGEVSEGEGVAFQTAGGIVPVDSALIRNLSATAGSDPQEYVRSILAYAQDLGL